VRGLSPGSPGYVITALVPARTTTTSQHVDEDSAAHADGSLGEPEELRTGWEPDAGLEAQIEFAARLRRHGLQRGIAPEWTSTHGRLARPLSKDGTLGEEKLFRGGKDLQSGFEKQCGCPLAASSPPPA